MIRTVPGVSGRISGADYLGDLSGASFSAHPYFWAWPVPSWGHFPSGAQATGLPAGGVPGGGGLTGLKPGKGLRPGCEFVGSGSGRLSPGSLAPCRGGGLSFGESQNGTNPHPADRSQCHAQWQSARAGVAANSTRTGNATPVNLIMLTAYPKFLLAEVCCAAVFHIREMIVMPVTGFAKDG